MSGGVPPPPMPSMRSSFSPDHHLWLSSLIWPDIPLQASISCIAVNPRCTVLATGTHTGHIYVWQLSAVHDALACPESRVRRLGSNALAGDSPASHADPPSENRPAVLSPAADGFSTGESAVPTSKEHAAWRPEDIGTGHDLTQGDCSGQRNATVCRESVGSRNDGASGNVFDDLPAGSCRTESSPFSSASTDAGEASFEAPLPLVPHLILISEWGGSAPLIECVFAVAAAPLVNACSEEVLVSIHSDSKLRIWSLLDGRCLSATKQFPYPLLSIRVLSDRRYVVLTGKTGAMVFDLWAHCLVCHLSLSLPGVVSPSTVFSRQPGEAALQAVPGGSVPDSARGPGGAGEFYGRRDEARNPLSRANSGRMPRRSPGEVTEAPEAWPCVCLTATATSPPPDCSEDGLRRVRTLFPNLLGDLPFPPLSSQGNAQPGSERQSNAERVVFRSSSGGGAGRPPPEKNTGVCPQGLPPDAPASCASSSSATFALFHQQSKPLSPTEQVLRGDSFSFLAFPQASAEDFVPPFPRLNTAPRHRATEAPGGKGASPLWPSDSAFFHLAPEDSPEPGLLPPFLEQPVTVAGLTPEGRLAVWDLQAVLASWEEQQTQLDGMGGRALFHGKRERTVFGSLVSRDAASSAPHRQAAGTTQGHSGLPEEAVGEPGLSGDRSAASAAVGVAAGPGRKGGLSGGPSHSNSTFGLRDPLAGDTAGDGGRDRKKGTKAGSAVGEGAAAVLQPMRTVFGGMFGVGGEDESDDEGDDTEDTQASKGVEPVFVSSVCCEPSSIPEVGGSGASSLLSVTASFLVALSSERLVVWRRLPRMCSPSVSPASISYDPFLDIPVPTLASPAACSNSGFLGPRCAHTGDSQDRSSQSQGEAEGRGDTRSEVPSLAWCPAVFGDTWGEGEISEGLPLGWSGLHLLPYSREVSRFCEELETLERRRSSANQGARAASENEWTLSIRGRGSSKASESRGSSMESGGLGTHFSCENAEAVLLAWTSDGALRAFLLPLLDASFRHSPTLSLASGGLPGSLSLAQGRLIGHLPDDLLGGEDTPTPVFLPLFSRFSSALSETPRRPFEGSFAERAQEGEAFSTVVGGAEVGERDGGDREEGRRRRRTAKIVGGLLSLGVSLEVSDRVTVASWSLETVGPMPGARDNPRQFVRASQNKDVMLALEGEGLDATPSPGRLTNAPSEHEARGPQCEAFPFAQMSSSSFPSSHPSSNPPKTSVLRLRVSLQVSISVGELWLLPSTLRSSLHRTLFPPVPAVLDGAREDTTRPSLPSRRKPQGGCLLLGRTRECAETGEALRARFWRLTGLLEERGHLREGWAYLSCLAGPALEGGTGVRGLDGGTRPTKNPLCSRTGSSPQVDASASLRGSTDTNGGCTYTSDRHILSWCLVESQGQVFLICSASDGAALGLCLNHVAARLRLHRHLAGETAGHSATCGHSRKEPANTDRASQGVATDDTLYLSGSRDLAPWPNACHALPSLVRLPTPATHPGLVAGVEAQGARRSLGKTGWRKRGPSEATPRTRRWCGDSVDGGEKSRRGEQEVWRVVAGSARGSPLHSLSGGVVAGGGSTTTCPPTSEDLEPDGFSPFSSEFSSQGSSEETFSEFASEVVSAQASSASGVSSPESSEDEEERKSPSSASPLGRSLSRLSTRRRVRPPPGAPPQAPTSLCAAPPVAVKTQVTHFCSLSSVLLAGGTSRGDILFWRLPSFSVCGYLPRALPAPVCAMLRVLSVCGGQGEAQFDSNCFLVADATGQLTLVDAAKCCGCTDTSSANPPDTEFHSALSARHQKLDGTSADRRHGVPSTNGATREPAMQTKDRGDEELRALQEAERDRQRVHHEQAVQRQQRSAPGARPDEQVASSLGSNLAPGLEPVLSEKGLVESPMCVHYRASTWSVRTPELLQAVPRPCNWSGVFPLERPEGAPWRALGFSGFLEGGFSPSASLVAPHAIRKVAVDLLSDTICCITVSARFFLWKIQTGQLLKEGPLSRIAGIFAPDVPDAHLFYSRTFLQNPHLYSSSPHLEMTVWGFALGHLQLASSSCCRCCHFACPCPYSSSASSPRRSGAKWADMAPNIESQMVAACDMEPCEQSGSQETLLNAETPTSGGVPPFIAGEPPSAPSSSEVAEKRQSSRQRRGEIRKERRDRGQRSAWASLCCHASAKSSIEAHRTLPSAAVLLLPVSQFLQPCYPPRVALPPGASGAAADRPAGLGSSRGAETPLAAHALALCSAFLPFGVNASVDAGLQELFAFLSPSPLPLVPGVIGADLAISFSLPLLLIHGILHDSYVRQALRAANVCARHPGVDACTSLRPREAAPCCHQPSLSHNLLLHQQAVLQSNEICSMDSPRASASLSGSSSCSSASSPSRMIGSDIMGSPLDGARECLESFSSFAAALAERDAVGTMHAASEVARAPAFPDAMSSVVSLLIQREQRIQLRKAGCSNAATPAVLAVQQRLWRLQKLPGLCRSAAALKALLASGPAAAVIASTACPPMASPRAFPSPASASLSLAARVRGQPASGLVCQAKGRSKKSLPSDCDLRSRLDLPPPPTCEALNLFGLPSVASKGAGALRVSAASPVCFSSASSLSLTPSFLGADASGGLGLGGSGRDSRGAPGFPQGPLSGRAGGYVFGLFLASSTSAFLSASVYSASTASRASEGARARLLQALDETQSCGAVGTTSRQLQIQIQHHQKVLYHHLHVLQMQQKRLEARLCPEQEQAGEAKRQSTDETEDTVKVGQEARVKKLTLPASGVETPASGAPVSSSSLTNHIRQLEAQQGAIREQLISLQQQLISLADGEYWGDEGRAEGSRRLIRGRERLVHLSLCVATAPWPQFATVQRFCEQIDALRICGPDAPALSTDLLNGEERGQEGQRPLKKSINPNSAACAPSSPPSTFSSLTSFSSLSSLASSPSTPASSGEVANARSDASNCFRLLLAVRQEERALWLRPGTFASKARFGSSGSASATGRDESRPRGGPLPGASEVRQASLPAAFVSGGRLPLAIGGWPLPRFALYKDTALSSPSCAPFLRLSGASLASPHVSAGTSLSFLSLLSAALVPTLTPPPPSVGARAALIQAFSDTFCLSFFPSVSPVSTAENVWPKGGGRAAQETLHLRHPSICGESRSQSRLTSLEDFTSHGPPDGVADQRFGLTLESRREGQALLKTLPPFPLDVVPVGPSSPLPSLWLLTLCFLHNCPSPSHSPHGSHPSVGASASSRAAVYVHLGACDLLRRTICAMEETQLLPFVDVCLQFLGASCALSQADQTDGLHRAEESGVAALPPNLADELDCAGQSEVALVLLTIIIYERPGLSKIAGLNVGIIVGHHLARAFLGALLPLAAAGPSASAGGIVAHASTGVGSQARGAVPPVARAELLMELFALGLGIVWESSCLFSRSISALLEDYVPRSLTAKLTGNNGAGEALLPDELLLCQLMAAMFAFTLRPQWSACSSLILTRLARTNFPLFVKVLGRAAGTVEFGSEYTAAALLTLVHFSARIPELSLELLPDMVEAVVRCLDPAEPHLRRRALNAATAALFHLVRCFPMATFHQQTQRFAVGCVDGLIILYDLRTATKWKVLEGHTGAVNCLSFSDDGSLLASYSSTDCTMRLWQSSSSGFFGGILGISAKSQKVIELPPCPKNIFWQSIPYQLETVRMVNKSKTEWMIRREDGKGYMVLVS
ncbi:UNVERIFIED_CONTAM: WD domain, G-beta repeat-containing protein [Hammondia hammondi]|eukprot:XP_008882680.1 WD domain, G-beta repeat-containing protein [Hammondia hammondi]